MAQSRSMVSPGPSLWHLFSTSGQWRIVGGREDSCSRAQGWGDAKSVTKKVFLKLFRNNSQRLSLVRLGHRHSINQSNRLQLTKISFPVDLQMQITLLKSKLD